MNNRYIHEILPLDEPYKQEIETLLNDKSKEGWEVVTIFSASLGVVEKSLFALLRKKAS